MVVTRLTLLHMERCEWRKLYFFMGGNILVVTGDLSCVKVGSLTPKLRPFIHHVRPLLGSLTLQRIDHLLVSKRPTINTVHIM